MADWADEIAAQLWTLPNHSGKVMDIEFAQSIATALRKAERKGRVAGLREAAEIIDEFGRLPPPGSDDAWNKALEAISEWGAAISKFVSTRASSIEQGEG